MLEEKDFRELTLTALTLIQNNSCKTTCMEILLANDSELWVVQVK